MIPNGEKPKAWWTAPQFLGINYRRAVAALEMVYAHPGKTAWELTGITGGVYADLSKGLQKGREHGLFRVEPEERAQGGVRFRYFASDDADSIVATWRERGLLEEHHA